MIDIGIIHCENGGQTIVDSADVEFLSQYKWNMSWDGYVFTTFWVGEKYVMKGIGALILNTEKGLQCDHINGDRLDNRRSNLRSVTMQQNQWNQGKRMPEKSTSKYKGVYWCKNHKSFRAQIRVGGKKIHLGSSRNQEDLAAKYNEAAKKHFGQFARLNKIEQEPAAVAVEKKG